METFNDLAIFIQGSSLYGRLDLPTTVFFVSVVFGQRQTIDQYWLLITFLRLLFLVTFRMSLLVCRSLNSVSSASSGDGSLLHPPLTICLNNSIQQISNFLIFSSFIYQACVPLQEAGSHTCPH